MRIGLAFLFLNAVVLVYTSAVGEEQTACGPLDVRFSAQASGDHRSEHPSPGKALVYVVEDFRKAPGELGNPTVRIGLDGKWMGAVRAKSYLSFEVDPGERHLCASWQSRLKRLSKLASFAHFSSEADKTYYFRARITYSSYGAGAANMNLDLEPVDPDEGKFLIATNATSQSHPSK
jgi:hypothetical protein